MLLQQLIFQHTVVRTCAHLQLGVEGADDALPHADLHPHSVIQAAVRWEQQLPRLHQRTDTVLLTYSQPCPGVDALDAFDTVNKVLPQMAHMGGKHTQAATFEWKSWWWGQQTPSVVDVAAHRTLLNTEGRCHIVLGKNKLLTCSKCDNALSDSESTATGCVLHFPVHPYLLDSAGGWFTCQLAIPELVGVGRCADYKIRYTVHTHLLKRLRVCLSRLRCGDCGCQCAAQTVHGIHLLLLNLRSAVR
uniref:Uncharacterized protein n=1 Tax=Lygus hesperus TaxID=30085 RepID=A0A0A9YQT4_LYGHE